MPSTTADPSTSGVPQLDLFFNYRVNPGDLKKKLGIEISDKEVEYSLITVSPDNKISLRLQGLKAEDKNLEASISIAKGGWVSVTVASSAPVTESSPSRAVTVTVSVWLAPAAPLKSPVKEQL